MNVFMYKYSLEKPCTLSLSDPDWEKTVVSLIRRVRWERIDVIGSPSITYLYSSVTIAPPLT